MADTKISALTGATTPLAGTEVVPLVQSGVTKKVPVSDLTAGRSISVASITASTGNFIVGTSGKGIDFSATAGTGTSELLADYEEGTWTPVVTASSGSITSYTATGNYTKTGRAVTVNASISITNAGTASGAMIVAGLPFTVGTFTSIGAAREDNLTGVMGEFRAIPSTANMYGVNYANATLIATSALVFVTLTYFV